MRQLFGIIIIFFLFSCSKDDGNEYAQYNAISTSQEVPLITENFTGNHNGWNFIDTGFLYNPDTHDYIVSQVSGGELTITSNSGAGALYFSYDSLKTLENFELECEIKFVKVKPGSSDSRGVCYLHWGFEDSFHYGNFIKFENNGLVDFGYPWGPTRAGIPVDGLDIYGYNKYTIRKAGNHIFYFVNEKYIGETKLLEIYGNLIGFRTFDHNVFMMRNFRFVKF